MEEKFPLPPVPGPMPALCPQCHQPVLPTYYFCPNCGKKLSEAPLSTSILTQVWIYAFSIALPIICYLAIGYWPAIKYMHSASWKARQIGIIALILLLLSSAVTFWIGIVWIQNTINSAMTSVGNINSFGNSL